MRGHLDQTQATFAQYLLNRGSCKKVPRFSAQVQSIQRSKRRAQLVPEPIDRRVQNRSQVISKKKVEKWMYTLNLLNLDKSRSNFANRCFRGPKFVHIPRLHPLNRHLQHSRKHYLQKFKSRHVCIPKPINAKEAPRPTIPSIRLHKFPLIPIMIHSKCNQK